jgi:hypothetical protein
MSEFSLIASMYWEKYRKEKDGPLRRERGEGSEANGTSDPHNREIINLMSEI